MSRLVVEFQIGWKEIDGKDCLFAIMDLRVILLVYPCTNLVSLAQIVHPEQPVLMVHCVPKYTEIEM